MARATWCVWLTPRMKRWDTHVYVCVCVFVCVCVCSAGVQWWGKGHTHTYTWTYANMHTHNHVRARTRTYIHTHTHTHTHTLTNVHTYVGLCLHTKKLRERAKERLWKRVPERGKKRPFYWRCISSSCVHFCCSFFHSRCVSLSLTFALSRTHASTLCRSLALSDSLSRSLFATPTPPPIAMKTPTHTLFRSLLFLSFCVSLFLWLAGEVRGTQSFARFGRPPSVMAFCAGVFVSECIFACTCVCVCVCVCVYKHKHTHTHTLVWKKGPITNSWFVVYVW